MVDIEIGKYVRNRLRKLGLRENYICTSFQDFETTEEALDNFSTGRLSLHNPAVVHFSRRAAIRASLLDTFGKDVIETIEAREMKPFHADYATLTAAAAHEHVARVLLLVDDTLSQCSEQDEDSFTFEFLGRALRNSRVSL